MSTVDVRVVAGNPTEHEVAAVAKALLSMAGAERPVPTPRAKDPVPITRAGTVVPGSWIDPDPALRAGSRTDS